MGLWGKGGLGELLRGFKRELPEESLGAGLGFCLALLGTESGVCKASASAA